MTGNGTMKAARTGGGTPAGPDHNDYGGVEMADIQSTHTCPICGQQAERSVDYHRDRRWPETYCYDAAGHAWIIRAGAR